MENQKAKGNTLGAMAATMKENSKMASSMAKAGGEELLILRPINTKESTKMTRKMDTVNSHGHQEIYTRDDIRMTKEKDLAKCNGLMDQHMKVIGFEGSNMAKAR